MKNLDWNRERYRTRDRLLDYNISLFPITPKTTILPSIYPWENITNSRLSNQLYEIAKNHGYTGNETDFLNKFSATSDSIVTGTLMTFPIPGIETNLYFDTETGILYYFTATNSPIDLNLIAKIGGAVVGQSIVVNLAEIITYIYLPVNALPLENLIFNCGNAAEYID